MAISRKTEEIDMKAYVTDPKAPGHIVERGGVTRSRVESGVGEGVSL